MVSQDISGFTGRPSFSHPALPKLRTRKKGRRCKDLAAVAQSGILFNASAEFFSLMLSGNDTISSLSVIKKTRRIVKARFYSSPLLHNGYQPSVTSREGDRVQSAARKVCHKHGAKISNRYIFFLFFGGGESSSPFFPL